LQGGCPLSGARGRAPGRPPPVAPLG